METKIHFYDCNINYCELASKRISPFTFDYVKILMCKQAENAHEEKNDNNTLQYFFVSV